VAGERKGYIVVHRQLGALCGLGREGLYWRANWPLRTPVVFAAQGSAEACRRAVDRAYGGQECEVQEYRKAVEVSARTKQCGRNGNG